MKKEKELEQRIEHLEKLIKQSGKFIEALEGDGLTDKPEFEIGEWVKYGKYCIGRVSDSLSCDGYPQVIAPNGSKAFHLKTKSEWEKATPKQIEKALIKEAERRGFVFDAKFISLEVSGIKYTGISKIEYHDSRAQEFPAGSVWQYDETTDTLINTGWGYINAVYHKGEWAEIVENTIEVNGYEAEFHDGYVKFECAEIENSIFREILWFIESTAVQNKGIGNRALTAFKIGEGLFDIETIKEINKRLK